MADGEYRYDRGSTLSVAPGLHIFRYMSFRGTGAPAVARVIPPIAGVTLLEMPGRERGMLHRPGDCLALRSERPSDVVIGLRRGSADGSLDASFRLEPIALAEQACAVAPAANPAVLSFLAHLANVGDAPFAQDVWAGGPDAPAAVEGLQIVAEGAAAALEMQVLIGGRPPRWSDWVGAGQFAGTRGRGLALIGLRLRLKPEAIGVEIAAEALFLGALVTAQRGRQVEFVSASQVDPLVGVKFAVRAVRAPATVDAVSGPDAQAREPRVRVFRASTVR